MQKRAFIIHGWGGYPGEGWLPWLAEELRKRGFIVEVPAMPNTDSPTIQEWVSHLSKIIGTPDKDTYLIGHSIGCQTILRYLEGLPGSEKIGSAVFVAGWFTLMNLETSEEKEIAKPWLETTIDTEKVKLHMEKSAAIFSDNDEVVPADNAEAFARKLGSKIITEHSKGHFSGSDGVTELPSALSAALEISK